MRMINIVLTELANSKLKAEENLEIAINAKSTPEERLMTIKSSLKTIIECEQMIKKWQDLTQSSEPSEPSDS